MGFLAWIKNGIKGTYGLQMPAFFPASKTTYDNSQSGLAATRVQGAIDEVNDKAENIETALAGVSVVKIGDVHTAGNNVTPNTQYTFTINDANILATDMIFTQLYINGAQTQGVTACRCATAAGVAYCNFLSSATYGSGDVIGFKYIIVRTS